MATKRMLTAAFVVAVAAACSEPPADRTTTSTAQLMAWVVDPSADVVWASAGEVITEAGSQSLAPTTDEGWDNVRNHAAIVAESGHLLMMPAHNRDDGQWASMCAAMTEAAIRARRAAEDRDAEALFDAGGRLYTVCLACHSRYITDVQEGD